MNGVTPAGEPRWTADEMMVVALARMLWDGAICFAGIGLPSAAAILAQRAHAPNLFLVYESGALGPRPAYLPLSIADSTLAETAETIVGVPELFNYWLQPGRIDFGILGVGQVDRHGNVNSTVIGGYEHPKVRLPGAGGAPEIASACRQTLLVVRQSVRTFVDPVDFITTAGQNSKGRTRNSLGFLGRGPAAVVTDIGIYEPDPASGELRLTRLMPLRTVDEAVASTGWDLVLAPRIEAVQEPTAAELEALRALFASTGGQLG